MLEHRGKVGSLHLDTRYLIMMAHAQLSQPHLPQRQLGSLDLR